MSRLSKNLNGQIQDKRNHQRHKMSGRLRSPPKSPSSYSMSQGKSARRNNQQLLSVTPLSPSHPNRVPPPLTLAEAARRLSSGPHTHYRDEDLVDISVPFTSQEVHRLAKFVTHGFRASVRLLVYENSSGGVMELKGKSDIYKELSVCYSCVYVSEREREVLLGGPSETSFSHVLACQLSPLFFLHSFLYVYVR